MARKFTEHSEKAHARDTIGSAGAHFFVRAPCDPPVRLVTFSFRAGGAKGQFC
jgi:hypothetical protein